MYPLVCHTPKTFMTWSPVVVVTLTATLLIAGFGNGRDIVLLTVAQASSLMSAFSARRNLS